MANNLIRRDPFSALTRFDPFSDIDDIFRDFFTAPALRSTDAMPPIRLDVSETERDYTIKAEIPGVQKDDIKVAIDGKRVSISAEVKQEKSAEGAGTGSPSLLRSERFYGQQYRSLTLPQNVDDGAAQAKYQDGILELTLPKKAGGGGKQLSIQ